MDAKPHVVVRDCLQLWPGLPGAVETLIDEAHFLDRPLPSTFETRQLRVRLSRQTLQAIEDDSTGALTRQYVSSPAELEDDFGVSDPLDEQGHSPVRGLVHRYRNRAALHLTNACASFCRFCLRKRKIGQRDYSMSLDDFERCLGYLRSHDEIRDLVLTGGDPLSLSNESLEFVLGALRAIPHLEILRIDTRFPVQTPERMDNALLATLRRMRPLYLILHVNHPGELTPASRDAIRAIGDQAVPLLSHTVLLRGVNDRLEVLEVLFMELVKLGVKPYHLYQANRVRGTSHFIVPLAEAMQIVRGLWGRASGLAVPIFVYNAEDGMGKVPLLPGSPPVFGEDGDIRFVNYLGEIGTYPEHPTARAQSSTDRLGIERPDEEHCTPAGIDGSSHRSGN
jgi:lysine 2,3-aminomutase